MLDAIHHVAVICSEYERSKRFYCHILGLPIIREVWRAERQSWKCDLQVGSIQIELFSFPNPPPRPSRPEARGLRHLAFRVKALDPIIARLESFGVAVEAIRIDEHTQQRFTFFADPDGLPLELYEDKCEGR
jgi:glyoxylase I family protein